MAFYISPSVNWFERDETLYPQEISDNIGALAGTFLWGPINLPTLITNGEEELVQRFFKPSDDAYLAFMVSADFFSYSKKGWVTRVAGPLATNAVPDGQTPIRVENDEIFEAINTNGYQFIARHSGALGNGITVSVADQDSYDTWEFRNEFEYAPQVGEYNIAVVDGSGAFSGLGATKQVERLVVSGRASGGVNQKETVAVSGTASGGIKQSERIAVNGIVSANGTITINGVEVALVEDETENDVALAIATALEDDPASPFENCYATNNIVFVTYKAFGPQTPISTQTVNGITIASTVTVSGNNNFSITFKGKTINLVNGNTADEVATRVVSVFNSDTQTFKNVVSNSATNFTFEYVAYGTQPSTPSEILGGVTFASAVDTAGDDEITISVFGQSVTVTNGDSNIEVASAIFDVLDDPIVMEGLEIENVVVNRNTISWTRPEVGVYVPLANPTTPQSGIGFDVSVTTPGRTGSVLERFQIVNTIPGSRFDDGSIQYYADAINQTSRYVFVGDVSLPLDAGDVVLVGGVDDFNVDLTSAYKRYENAEEMDVNYIIDTGNGVNVQKAISDIASTRRDCFGFVSPPIDTVLNNPGNETVDVVQWSSVELNRETSYLIKDSGWAQVYDRYNDKYRWIPVTGGTAGLKARTDYEAEPWISPAGYEYGRYKNYIKLAWSPNKPQRDELHKAAVNSVVSFKGEGIILYNDKTSLTRPSAFQAINVRSAFIVAQKSLANFAKYYLFKNNNEFTRAQFTNACRPFLRNMKGRGAWEDHRFIADESNNGPSVRRERKMNAKILIKPEYSINYIDLTFVAIGNEVSFDEFESNTTVV